MEHKLAMQICKRLLKQGTIPQEEKEIYVYGFELFFSFLISTGTILLLGILFGQICNTIIFLCLFMFIRRSTGGFHAKTYLRCQLCTVSFYLLVMFLSIYTIIPLWAFGLLAATGGTTILLIGPIENPNKPLTTAEKHKHKWVGFFLFELLVIGGYWSGYLQLLFYNTVFYTLTLIIILMMIPKLTERRASA